MDVFVVAVLLVGTILLWVGAAVRFLGAIFSLKSRRAIAAHPVLHAFWLVVVAVTAFAFFVMPVIYIKPHHTTALAKVGLAALATACNSYTAEYGSFPKGDNVVITRALTGDNARRIVFIELRQSGRNRSGEAVDPWGTPCRFTLVDGQSPQIFSAGPDKAFGTKDDLIAPNTSTANPGSN